MGANGGQAGQARLNANAAGRGGLRIQTKRSRSTGYAIAFLCGLSTWKNPGFCRLIPFHPPLPVQARLPIWRRGFCNPGRRWRYSNRLPSRIRRIWPTGTAAGFSISARSCPGRLAGSLAPNSGCIIICRLARCSSGLHFSAFWSSLATAGRSGPPRAVTPCLEPLRSTGTESLPTDPLSPVLPGRFPWCCKGNSSRLPPGWRLSRGLFPSCS